MSLASQDIRFGGGDGGWTQLNFTLTPSASTTCVGLANSTAEVDCGKLGCFLQNGGSVNKIQQNTRFTKIRVLFVCKSLKDETPPCI